MTLTILLWLGVAGCAWPAGGAVVERDFVTFAICMVGVVALIAASGMA
jgi:hypothetical protein